VQEPRWVERLVVDAIHFDMVSTHGGLPGLRDEPLLESALARPRQRFAYDETCDPAALAAAYGYGICADHPFQDGNKRVAFVVMDVFAGLNGFEIEAPEADVVRVMLALASGDLTEEQLAEWLRGSLVERGTVESD